MPSPSCHLAECKTPLSPRPSSKTCPDMGLRTVLTVQKPKKATPKRCHKMMDRRTLEANHRLSVLWISRNEVPTLWKEFTVVRRPG
ncbi:hypothetical protein TNCV_2869121 [Trichonephila clavipes]|nr:hypothetical protein TNCV_2869121 [Trichonephila clavipes]